MLQSSIWNVTVFVDKGAIVDVSECGGGPGRLVSIPVNGTVPRVIGQVIFKCG